MLKERGRNEEIKRGRRRGAYVRGKNSSLFLFTPLDFEYP
jgi:hypothetical protein